jgi:hypothetical protein
LNQAKQWVDQLSAAGKPIDDDDLISFVVSGLNPMFHTFVTIHSFATSDHDMTFADFQSELLNHEIILENQLHPTITLETGSFLPCMPSKTRTSITYLNHLNSKGPDFLISDLPFDPNNLLPEATSEEMVISLHIIKTSSLLIFGQISSISKELLKTATLRLQHLQHLVHLVKSVAKAVTLHLNAIIEWTLPIKEGIPLLSLQQWWHNLMKVLKHKIGWRIPEPTLISLQIHPTLTTLSHLMVQTL